MAEPGVSETKPVNSIFSGFILEDADAESLEDVDFNPSGSEYAAEGFVKCETVYTYTSWLPQWPQTKCSFIVPTGEFLAENPTAYEAAEKLEEKLAGIIQSQDNSGNTSGDDGSEHVSLKTMHERLKTQLQGAAATIEEQTEEPRDKPAAPTQLSRPKPRPRAEPARKKEAASKDRERALCATLRQQANKGNPDINLLLRELTDSDKPTDFKRYAKELQKYKPEKYQSEVYELRTDQGRVVYSYRDMSYEHSACYYFRVELEPKGIFEFVQSDCSGVNQCLEWLEAWTKSDNVMR